MMTWSAWPNDQQAATEVPRNSGHPRSCRVRSARPHPAWDALQQAHCARGTVLPRRSVRAGAAVVVPVRRFTRDHCWRRRFTPRPSTLKIIGVLFSELAHRLPRVGELAGQRDEVPFQLKTRTWARTPDVPPDSSVAHPGRLIVTLLFCAVVTAVGGGRWLIDRHGRPSVGAGLGRRRPARLFASTKAPEAERLGQVHRLGAGARFFALDATGAVCECLTRSFLRRRNSRSSPSLS